MAKRQTKREKRANEIAEIAAQLVANVPPTMLLYVHDVMARAALALEDAKRFMTHDEFDRITDDEDELFTAAYVRAAMARSAEEYTARRGRDEAVVAILAAEQDRARERAAARERDRARRNAA